LRFANTIFAPRANSQMICRHVPHGGVSGPDGCRALDVFTPPRAGIVAAMTG